MNKLLTTLGIAGMLIPTPAPAAWQAVGGPVGGIGYDVRIHPNNKNIMYLTDNAAGVGISTDAGKNWKTTNTGISIKSGETGDLTNIFSLNIDPNTPSTLWAGTRGSNGQYGIFKSIDNGQTWEKKDNGIDGVLSGYPNASLVFRGFTVEPGNSNIVYAMAQLDTGVFGKTFTKSKGRIFKSTNGGESWNTIWEGNNLARYLHINPSNTNILYASTGIFDVEAFDSDCAAMKFGGEGVIKSTNAGLSWNNINNGIDNPYIGTLRMHPTNPDVLFAGGSAGDACQIPAGQSGSLFKTTDGGFNWIKVGADILGENISSVNFAPSNPSIVYAAFENAIYRSDDDGDSWVAHAKPNSRGIGPAGMNMGIPIDLVVDPDDPDIVYVNNYGGGVFKSDDAGITWKIWSRGITGSEIRDIAVSDNDNSLLYAAAKSGIFKSLNYGSDWIGISNDEAISVIETSSIAVSPTDEKNLLLGADFNAIIYHSSDAGVTTRKVHQQKYKKDGGSQSQQYHVIRFATSDSAIVYAGISAKNGVPKGTVISKSTDGGSSFTPLTSPMDGRNIEDIYIDKNNVNIVYVATRDADPGDDLNAAGLFKTTDGGINWLMVLADVNVGALTHMANNTLVAGSLWGGGASGIYLSNDAGLNWTGPYTTGLGMEPYITALTVSPDGQTLYAAEGFTGVFSSTDGQTWTPFMDGLQFKAVKQLVSNKHALIAATNGGGVYRYLFDQTDITPANFIFANRTNVSRDIWVESDSVTISDISSAANISIMGGEYAINEGEFSRENSLISNNDVLKIRIISPTQYVAERTATISIGDTNQTFTIRTKADITPDDFYFSAVTNVALETTVNSTTIPITGLSTSTDISITGGLYSINGNEFSANKGLIYNNDTVTIQINASAQYTTNTTATLTIGELSRTWIVSTVNDPTITAINDPPPTTAKKQSNSGALSIHLFILFLCLLTYRKTHTRNSYRSPSK